jgi:hypothetical protein
VAHGSGGLVAAATQLTESVLPWLDGDYAAWPLRSGSAAWPQESGSAAWAHDSANAAPPCHDGAAPDPDPEP